MTTAQITQFEEFQAFLTWKKAKNQTGNDTVPAPKVVVLASAELQNAVRAMSRFVDGKTVHAVKMTEIEATESLRALSRKFLGDTAPAPAVKLLTDPTADWRVKPTTKNQRKIIFLRYRELTGTELPKGWSKVLPNRGAASDIIAQLQKGIVPESLPAS